MGRSKKVVQAPPLLENESVRELLSILEANHMPAAKDLLAVIGQVGTMEKHLADMVTELAAMRRELAEAQRQNHPIRAALQKAVLLLQAQVLDMRDTLAALKQEIVGGCQAALEAFREKGLSALRDLSGFFKLRPGLEALQDNINSGIRHNEAAISKIEAMSAEYHEAGRHIANIGRTMAGKESIPEARTPGRLAKTMEAPFRADSACLKAMRRCVNAALGAVARLEKTERKPPIMETLEKLDKEITQSGREAPDRTRSQRATHNER